MFIMFPIHTGSAWELCPKALSYWEEASSDQQWSYIGWMMNVNICFSTQYITATKTTLTELILFGKQTNSTKSINVPLLLIMTIWYYSSWHVVNNLPWFHLWNTVKSVSVWNQTASIILNEFKLVCLRKMFGVPRAGVTVTHFGVNR